jgi:hypothetical protein
MTVGVTVSNVRTSRRICDLPSSGSQYTAGVLNWRTVHIFVTLYSTLLHNKRILYVNILCVVSILLVIYCTFNTRILIFKWRHVSVLMYHLQAIF